MFQGRFKDASRRRVSKGVLGTQGFEGFKGIKGVSRNFQGCFKKVPCMFYGSFEEVFQENNPGMQKMGYEAERHRPAPPAFFAKKLN